MAIQIAGYNFVGPYSSTSSLRESAGVYAILDGRSSPSLIYVGESASVKSRVENNHEREPCWIRESNSGIYYAAYYTQGNRTAIESEIRRRYNPPCNRY